MATFAHAGCFDAEYWPDEDGLPTPGSLVGFYIMGTLIPATLWADRERLTEIDNPFTLDELGNNPPFFADPGDYDARRVVSGVPGVEKRVCVPVDDADAVEVASAEDIPFDVPGFAADNVEDAIIEVNDGARITQLDPATAVTVDDLFLMVDDPLNTPADLKVTAEVLRQFIAAGNGQSWAPSGTGRAVGVISQLTLTTTLTAGSYYVRPFSIRKGGSFDRARIRVTTGVAAAMVHVGIYSQPDPAASPLQLTLVHDLGAFDASVATTVTSNGAWVLNDNTRYWVVVATLAAGVAMASSASDSDLIGASSSFVNGAAALTLPGYIGGAMPAVLDISAATINTRMPGAVLFVN